MYNRTSISLTSSATGNLIVALNPRDMFYGAMTPSANSFL